VARKLVSVPFAHRHFEVLADREPDHLRLLARGQRVVRRAVAECADDLITRDGVGVHRPEPAAHALPELGRAHAPTLGHGAPRQPFSRLARLAVILSTGGGLVSEDEWSFDAFVRARMPALLRFAHALTGDPHTAADLVQDALERTGVRWSKLRRTDDPEAYVRRAIVNGRTSRWRKLRRESLVDAVPEPRGQADPSTHDADLWRLLATLPARQRAVVVLRYYEDMSEDQIARTLGCAPGTVKSQSSKALAKLRAALADDETYSVRAERKPEATWSA
jgi:RNA polymerase sigma-70 factor (sigma-E family)